jgi:hypothetical protein
MVITAFMVSTPLQASAAAEVDFTAQAAASGLTTDQAADLQKRVDEVLATIPGGKQVSATEVRFDGLKVTVDPLFSKSTRTTSAISCANGWFCIDVQDTRFEFYTCQKWRLSDWLGRSPYNNNQTTGTIARAYAQDGSTVVWRHTAKGSGDVDVGPWWFFKPC